MYAIRSYYAQQIEIRDGAEITGDLIYRGPAPRIDPGAKIGGQVVSRPLRNNFV